MRRADQDDVAIESAIWSDVMTRLIFVGECRSLAAKPLFEALSAMGVDPTKHEYLNLWTDAVVPVVPWQRVSALRSHVDRGRVIVALGKRVSAELARRGIQHVALVHPAARGAIRKRERYHAHVADKLGGVL